jgi:hypothetical protein
MRDQAIRYGWTFNLHPSEKRGALHHLQITQHTRSPHPSVHLRLAIPVPRPLLSGLQSGGTKRPRENLLVKINRSPTPQPRVSPRSPTIRDLTCTARTSLLFFTVAEACYHATHALYMHMHVKGVVECANPTYLPGSWMHIHLATRSLLPTVHCHCPAGYPTQFRRPRKVIFIILMHEISKCRATKREGTVSKGKNQRRTQDEIPNPSRRT